MATGVATTTAMVAVTTAMVAVTTGNTAGAGTTTGTDSSALIRKKKHRDCNDMNGKERDRPPPLPPPPPPSSSPLSPSPSPSPSSSSSSSSSSSPLPLPSSLVVSLSKDLGRNWKNLGRFLNVGDPTLDSFEKEYDTQEAAYQTILYWARFNGRSATRKNLAVALRGAGRADLAELVEL